MNINLWIVTFVDYGETCDGKARVLAVCKSREEAEACVKHDIEKWADDHAGENIEVDFDGMSVSYSMYNDDCGCEWNIEEKTVNVNDEDEHNDLVDNGQLDFNFS